MIRAALALVLIPIMLAAFAGCGTAPPEADFSALPLSAYAPEEVQFTDLSEGNVSSWAWDFDGDGVIDSILPNPTQVFANPGNYTVSLTVTGPGGNSTQVKADYIEMVPCPRFADFVADNTVMEGRHPIQFTDLTIPPVGNVTSWAWDFETDGVIDSYEQNPEHTYRTDGDYTVTLTVTTSECDDTLTRHEYIDVSGCRT
jgi:PKD repeat protein